MTPAALFCTRCGTPLPGDARFCPACGQTVTAAAATPAPPPPRPPVYEPPPYAPLPYAVPLPPQKAGSSRLVCGLVGCGGLVAVKALIAAIIGGAVLMGGQPLSAPLATFQVPRSTLTPTATFQVPSSTLTPTPTWNVEPGTPTATPTATFPSSTLTPTPTWNVKPGTPTVTPATSPTGAATRPANAPTNTPAEVVKVWEEAFNKVVKDPGFIEWGKNRKMVLYPLNAAEFDKVVRETYPMVEKYQQMLREK